MTLLATLQGLKAKATEVISDNTSNYIAQQMQASIMTTADIMIKFKITDDQESELYSAWQASPEELNEAIQALQVNLRHDLFMQAWRPITPAIHNHRFLALLLSEADYQDYLANNNILYEQFQVSSNRIVDSLIVKAINHFRELELSIEKARKELPLPQAILEE